MSSTTPTPSKVLLLVAPVCVAGVAAFVAAAASYASTPHSAGDVAAVVGLFLGMVLAERFPVPVEGMDAGGVTLGFVFACCLGSAYGFLQGAWPFGVLEAIWAVIALRRWMISRRISFTAPASNVRTPKRIEGTLLNPHEINLRMAP